MRIAAEYTFEAAHRLPMVPDTHKCSRMHGHNYRVIVSIDGPLDERGFVVDYAELDEVVQPLINRLDHRCLNDIDGLSNPTAEIIAGWLKERIQPNARVRVYETSRYWAETT